MAIYSNFDEDSNTQTVRVKDELDRDDLSTVITLFDEQPDANQLMLDLTEMSFVDAMTYDALTALIRGLRNRGNIRVRTNSLTLAAY